MSDLKDETIEAYILMQNQGKFFVGFGAGRTLWELCNYAYDHVSDYRTGEQFINKESLMIQLALVHADLQDDHAYKVFKINVTNREYFRMLMDELPDTGDYIESCWKAAGKPFALTASDLIPMAMPSEQDIQFVTA